MRGLLILVISGALSALALVVSNGVGVDNFVARAVLCVALSIFLAILFDAISLEGERTFVIMFSLYFIDILILPALAQAARGWFPFFSKVYPEADVTRAAEMVLAFASAFGVAYAFRPMSAAKAPPLRPLLSGRRCLVLASACVAIAFAGFVVDPAEFLTRRGDLDSSILGIDPASVAVNATVRNLGYLGLLVCLTYVRWGLGHARRLAIILCPVALGVAALVNFPLNVPRFTILAMAICTILLFSRSHTVRFKMYLSAVYTVALLTIFPLLSQASRGQRGDALFVNTFRYYGESVDFDGFQSLINIRSWIDHDGVQWGRQLISALLVFVPRSVWPGKAFITGGRAAQYAGYQYLNVSAPLPGEFYADFGIIGVVLGGGLVAWLIIALDRKRAETASLGARAALSMGAGFVAILARGSLIGVTALSAVAVIISLMVGWVQIANNPKVRET